MDHDPTIPAPLPVIRIILDTLQFVWDKRLRMLRALFIPATAALLLTFFPFLTHLISQTVNPPFYRELLFGWLYFLIQLAPYTLFAITCHRLVLIDDPGVPKYGLLKWTKRESQFLAWFVIIIIICALLSGVINSFFLSIIISDVEAGASEETIQSTRPLTYLINISILYIFARLSVLYPAIALDHPVSAQWAWRLTAHNGWRLLLVVGLLPWVVYFLATLFIGETVTIIDYMVFMFAWIILLAVQIVALSFTYQHLTETEA